MNPWDQTIAQLHSRLSKGADLLWADEQDGMTDPATYARRLALFEELLAAYRTKCRAAMQVQVHQGTLVEVPR